MSAELLSLADARRKAEAEEIERQKAEVEKKKAEVLGLLNSQEHSIRQEALRWLNLELDSGWYPGDDVALRVKELAAQKGHLSRLAKEARPPPSLTGGPNSH